MTNFFTHKFRKKSPIEIIGIIIFGALFITGLAILFGFVIMWLWNWLMPEIFGLTTLTYWQAVGLFILLRILIGGCGGSGSKKSNKKCDKDNKTDFSKWKHYDKFWKEEGDKYYTQYVDKKTNPNQDNPQKTDLE
ncbi:hypothetical protein [uncultured Tenacibaculum sp.]|uniref:hypothetical protein n=1 Tax=uncultured Tenacibaculum sp. TaxID=174713 RepID=UPI002636231D|nr:hypothetical protein [uncultured Tenacibaculum sp.]